MNKCEAKTRSGTPCKQKAGWGTEHVGEGRCKLHGGNAGRPIIHGRYSVKHLESLQEKHIQFLNDPEAGNLLPELALLRALFQDFIDRFGEPLRLSIEHRGHARDMILDISKLVERIARIRNQTALTAAEIQLIYVKLGEIVVEYIPDDRLIEFFDKLGAALGIPIEAQALLIGAPSDDGED